MSVCLAGPQAAKYWLRQHSHTATDAQGTPATWPVMDSAPTLKSAFTGQCSKIKVSIHLHGTERPDPNSADATSCPPKPSAGYTRRMHSSLTVQGTVLPQHALLTHRAGDSTPQQRGEPQTQGAWWYTWSCPPDQSTGSVHSLCRPHTPGWTLQPLSRCGECQTLLGQVLLVLQNTRRMWKWICGAQIKKFHSKQKSYFPKQRYKVNTLHTTEKSFIPHSCAHSACKMGPS